MKKAGKAAFSFKKLGATELSKIKGGGWVEYTDEEGNVIKIWV